MPFSWHDSAQLAAEIRALPALEKQQVVHEAGDILIDAWVPGAPLFISFAFVSWDKPGDFYLFGRSKKLEGLSGQRLNRIMLRDRSNQWYWRGVAGVGDSVEQVVARLQQVIEIMAPSEVWCIGESMGGYGAILHGILLNASRIVSFGALSSFSAQFAAQYHDMRWHRSMEMLGDTPLNNDLPALARERGYANPLHIVLGTSAGPEAPDAVNLDVMHGQRFADMPGVRYHYYPEGQHAVTHWLNQQRKFDDILMHCLFDTPEPAPLPAALPPQPAPPSTLAEWPANFAPLDAAKVAGAPGNCHVLVHTITPGAPLLVCFSDLPMGFDYVQDRIALEASSGKPLNQVVMRDPARAAFLRGVPALGNDLESVAASLRALIERIQPSRVVCIGAGPAGFSALAVGAMLNVERILAINPLSQLDAALAECWHDKRYRQLLTSINQPPTAPGPRDVLPLLARYKGKVHIACCAMGVGTGDDVGSHDAVHAQRLATLPNVKVQAWSAYGDLLRLMREKKMLMGFIGYCGLG